MNLKEQEQRVAVAWKDVLVSFGVKGIKEISFNGNFFNIGFDSKSNALKAIECRLLTEYNYDFKGRGFKYPHRLIGASK